MPQCPRPWEVEWYRGAWHLDGGDVGASLYFYVAMAQTKVHGMELWPASGCYAQTSTACITPTRKKKFCKRPLRFRYEPIIIRFLCVRGCLF
jgi:hypothetical protein